MLGFAPQKFLDGSTCLKWDQHAVKEQGYQQEADAGGNRYAERTHRFAERKSSRAGSPKLGTAEESKDQSVTSMPVAWSVWFGAAVIVRVFFFAVDQPA